MICEFFVSAETGNLTPQVRLEQEICFEYID